RDFLLGTRGPRVDRRDSTGDEVLLGQVVDPFDIDPVVEERAAVGAHRVLRCHGDPGDVAAHADAEGEDLGDRGIGGEEVLGCGDGVCRALACEPAIVFDGRLALTRVVHGDADGPAGGDLLQVAAPGAGVVAVPVEEHDELGR